MHYPMGDPPWGGGGGGPPWTRGQRQDTVPLGPPGGRGSRGVGRDAFREEAGGSETQTFVYQKQPNSIAPSVNLVFPTVKSGSQGGGGVLSRSNTSPGLGGRARAAGARPGRPYASGSRRSGGVCGQTAPRAHIHRPHLPRCPWPGHSGPQCTRRRSAARPTAWTSPGAHPPP